MSEKVKKEAFDFFQLSNEENEIRLNRVMGIIAILSLGVTILCYFLDLIGIFVLPDKQMLVSVVAMIPFSLYSFYFGVIKRVYLPWIKYSQMIALWAIVTILFARMTMHAILILCIPIVMALLYNNRWFLHVSVGLGVAAICLSHLLSVHFSIVNDPLINTYYRAMIYGCFPRLIEYGLICVIADFVAVHNSGIINRGYYYVKQATDLLEKQRTSHYEIINNLATITENRSLETGEHISRVFRYMMIFTEHLDLSEEEAYDIALASMLHDVGKLRVSEEILNKPGKLTPEEFEIIKTHAAYGKQLLSHTGNQVMDMAAIIADQHHERWDGTGYHHLKGDEINIYAQLMSVIDVFDALTSVRCYKPAWSFEAACKEITDNRGTQFSPFAVDLFSECLSEIKEIYRECNPGAESGVSLQQR